MRLNNVIVFILLLSSGFFGVSDCLAGYELIGVIEQYSRIFGPVGDINNDGYSDFAALQDVDELDNVNIYLGGEEPEFEPFITLSGDTLSIGYITGAFGSKITSGDINGDGYSDVIISAPLYSRTFDESFEGKVYVFFGGEEMDSIPDVILTNDRLGERYGSEIACGDINNDGIDDLVVFCFGYNIWGTLPRFYIYYGGEDYEADLIWDYEDYIEESRKLQMGDINGDGYCDLLSWPQTVVPHEIRVRFGSEVMDTTIDMFIRCPESFGGSGDKFEIVGDINGDGYLDLFVNFSTYINDNFSRPFYYGGPDIDTLYDYMCQQPGFSSSYVENLGDINIDGYDDIMFYPYIYYGGSPPDSFYGSEIEYPEEYRSYGPPVNVRDINGSSYEELICKARRAENDERILAIFSFRPIVDILEDDNQLIASNIMINSYPNPFNNSTTINFNSTQGGDIELVIYNLLGGLVKLYTIENHHAGEGNIFWDGTDVNSVGVPSGIYFIKLNCAGQTAVKKITFLK
ncbi:MAG: T9SS type A sorting domain-containing protein [bacterium]|nr:T9SS type A sorting domain-containing protein [bacterium]